MDQSTLNTPEHILDADYDPNQLLLQFEEDQIRQLEEQQEQIYKEDISAVQKIKSHKLRGTKAKFEVLFKHTSTICGLDELKTHTNWAAALQIYLLSLGDKARKNLEQREPGIKDLI